MPEQVPSKVYRIPRQATATAAAPKPASKAAVKRSILAMVKLTGRTENRLGAAVGGLLGGFVPVATYVVSHYEVHSWTDIKVALIAGGLIYSAGTVLQWARRALGDWYKAVGFVVLVEGVMISSDIPALALTALAFLMAINGMATAVSLIQQDT